MASKTQHIRPIGETVRDSVYGILSGKKLHGKSPPPSEEKEPDDKNPIIAVYRTHILFLLPRLLLYLFFAALFVGIGIVVSNVFFDDHFLVLFLAVVVIIPIFLNMAMQSIIYWAANVTVIREKNLIFHKYYGIFKQSTEVRSIGQIKSFDLIQSGVMQYIFNYGDIEVASIISGASKNIVLHNIYPIKEAYTVLSEHIAKLESTEDIVPDSDIEQEKLDDE